MTNQEWAVFFSAVGFSGYALVIGTVLVIYLRKNTVLNLKRLLVGSAIFIVLIGAVSATSAFTQPPFGEWTEVNGERTFNGWLSPAQAAQATALYVWCTFFFVLAGILRRA